MQGQRVYQHLPCMGSMHLIKGVRYAMLHPHYAHWLEDRLINAG